LDATEKKTKIGDDDEQIIDVTSNGEPDLPRLAPPELSFGSAITYLKSPPETEIVREATSQIGVKLKPIEVYPGVFAHALEEMILAACKCFLENLVQTSLAKGFERLGNKRCPSVLTMEDVFHSIQSIPEFDFLTNKFLGKNISIDTSNKDSSAK